MTEEITTHEAEPAQEQPATDPAQDGTDWKAEARKWESRAKENHAKIEELQAQANRATELEEQVATLNARLDDIDKANQLNAIKNEITEGSGISPDLLRGTTREELTEHFEQLSAVLNNRAPEPSPIILGQGATPDVPEPDALRLAARELFGRRN